MAVRFAVRVAAVFSILLALARPAPAICPTDYDRDGDFDLADFLVLQQCFSGPGVPAAPGCEPFDYDLDLDVDLSDLVDFQARFTGPRDVADQFAIAIGDAVADALPAPGAGNIEAPGDFDVYTFNADPGQVVFFDAQGDDGGSARWICIDEDGTELFRPTCLGCSDPGTITLERGGAYTICVVGQGDSVPTYAFQVWDVPAPDEFAIAIGDAVADGSPARGLATSSRPARSTSTPSPRCPAR